MFGLNSQTANQSSIDHTDQQLPVGGDDLLPSSVPDNTRPISQPTNDSNLSFSSSDDMATSDHDDLFNIKKDALQQLTPLVSQLDQSPEEKFRTIMMLIQATDDKTKLRSAYEAAIQIPDEKVKAQALLDVVNEINYFTHPDTQ